MLARIDGIRDELGTLPTFVYCVIMHLPSILHSEVETCDVKFVTECLRKTVIRQKCNLVGLLVEVKRHLVICPPCLVLVELVRGVYPHCGCKQQEEQYPQNRLGTRLNRIMNIKILTYA